MRSERNVRFRTVIRQGGCLTVYDAQKVPYRLMPRFQLKSNINVDDETREKLKTPYSRYPKMKLKSKNNTVLAISNNET